MKNETPEGDFLLRATEERFRFAMTSESLLIQVSGQPPNFTFIADISEACALRDWLNEHLDLLDQPNQLREMLNEAQQRLAVVRRQRDDVTAALNASSLPYGASS